MKEVSPIAASDTRLAIADIADRDARCHVVHVVEPFSAGIVESISRILHALPPDRFRVTLLHSMRPETPANYRERLPAHVETIRWNAAREINPAADLRALAELWRHLRTLQPNVVHAHSSKAGVLARLACRLLGYRCIYSPRAFSFLRLDVPARKRRLYRTIERFGARLGAVTVGASQSELELARELGGRSRLIRNMIDVDSVRDAVDRHRASASTRFTTGISGRLSPQKNVPLFMRIAGLCPEIDFVWIGGDAAELDATEVPPNVRFTGWLPRERVLGEVAGLDALVQTSLWEGLPISVLEAMALEKPVVAFPAVGNRDVVEDGANGFLCSDAEEFADRLRQLAGDAELRRTMGAKSLEILRRDYNSAINAGQWRDLYLEIAGREA